MQRLAHCTSHPATALKTCGVTREHGNNSLSTRHLARSAHTHLKFSLDTTWLESLFQTDRLGSVSSTLCYDDPFMDATKTLLCQCASLCQ